MDPVGAGEGRVWPRLVVGVEELGHECVIFFDLLLIVIFCHIDLHILLRSCARIGDFGLGFVKLDAFSSAVPLVNRDVLHANVVIDNRLKGFDRTLYLVLQVNVSTVWVEPGLPTSLWRLTLGRFCLSFLW